MSLAVSPTDPAAKDSSPLSSSSLAVQSSVSPPPAPPSPSRPLPPPPAPPSPPPPAHRCMESTSSAVGTRGKSEASKSMSVSVSTPTRRAHSAVARHCATRTRETRIASQATALGTRSSSAAALHSLDCRGVGVGVGVGEQSDSKTWQNARSFVVVFSHFSADPDTLDDEAQCRESCQARMRVGGGWRPTRRHRDEDAK